MNTILLFKVKSNNIFKNYIKPNSLLKSSFTVNWFSKRSESIETVGLYLFLATLILLRLVSKVLILNSELEQK